jgi:hypothetical protein
MLHPFRVGQRADRVLYLEKRNRQYRCAKNKIVGWNGRMIVHWHFERATLRIVWSEQGYVVDEILPALDTGKRISTKKAALTAKEAGKQLEEFK